MVWQDPNFLEQAESARIQAFQAGAPPPPEPVELTPDYYGEWLQRATSGAWQPRPQPPAPPPIEQAAVPFTSAYEPIQSQAERSKQEAMEKQWSAAPQGTLRQRLEQQRQGQSQYGTIPQRVKENPLEIAGLVAGGVSPYWAASLATSAFGAEAGGEAAQAVGLPRGVGATAGSFLQPGAFTGGVRGIGGLARGFHPGQLGRATVPAVREVAEQAVQRTPQQVARDLAEAVKTAEKGRPVQAALRAQERARRTAPFAAMQERATTIEGAQRARGALSGAYPQFRFHPPKITTPDEESLVRGINDAALSPFHKAAAIDALASLKIGAIPQPAELRELRRVYPELADEIGKNKGKVAGIWDNVIGVLGIPQAAQTFLDASGTLRQAAVLGWSNPQEFARAVQREARVITARPGGAGNAVDDIYAEIARLDDGLRQGFRGRDVGLHYYGAAKEAGDQPLGFTSLNDSFVSRMVQKFPGMERSRQAMGTVLDHLGEGVYAREAKKMFQAGITDPEQYRAMARVINHARGYGGIRAPDIVKGVNAFYSPRYLSSRVQVVSDPVVEMLRGNPRAAGLAARNLVGFIGINATPLALGAQLGAWDLVSDDPLSTDFMKARIGNTRIDPWAGTLPLVRAASRIGALGLQEAGLADFGYTYSGKSGQDGIQGVITDFLGGRLGPVPSFVAEGLGWKKAYPDSGEMLSARRAFETFTPFIIQAVEEDWRNGDMGFKGALQAAGAGAASAVGLGTVAYQPGFAETAEKEAIPALGLPAGTKYSDLGSGEKRKVQEWITQNRPDLERQESDEFQDVREYEATEYTPELDRLNAALRAGMDPTQVKKEADILRAERRGVLQGVYGEKDISEIEKLRKKDPNNMRVLEYDYFRIPDTAVDKFGSTDWDKVEAEQERFINQLPAGIKERFRSNIEQQPQHELLETFKRAGQALDSYYKLARDPANPTPEERQKQREFLIKNPDADYQQWLTRGGSLQTTRAAEQALQSGIPRPVKLQSADGTRGSRELTQTDAPVLRQQQSIINQLLTTTGQNSETGKSNISELRTAEFNADAVAYFLGLTEKTKDEATGRTHETVYQNPARLLEQTQQWGRRDPSTDSQGNPIALRLAGTKRDIDPQDTQDLQVFREQEQPIAELIATAGQKTPDGKSAREELRKADFNSEALYLWLRMGNLQGEDDNELVVYQPPARLLQQVQDWGGVDLPENAQFKWGGRAGVIQTPVTGENFQVFQQYENEINQLLNMDTDNPRTRKNEDYRTKLREKNALYDALWYFMGIGAPEKFYWSGNRRIDQPNVTVYHSPQQIMSLVQGWGGRADGAVARRAQTSRSTGGFGTSFGRSFGGGFG